MFSNNLTALRKNKKLAQAKITNILGITRTTHTSYEQGRRTPDIKTQRSCLFFRLR